MEEITKRILLVEDDPNFGIVLKEYLTINNYDVVLAKNGIFLYLDANDFICLFNAFIEIIVSSFISLIISA